MKGTKVIAAVGIASLLLGIAIGPGLTLFRCLLTGAVSLSCCCEPILESDAQASQPTVASDCCAVQRIEPAGRGLRAAGPAVQPLNASLFSALVAGVAPALSSFEFVRIVRPPGEPRPRWLSAGALLL